jgi:hypothetical protein
MPRGVYKRTKKQKAAKRGHASRIAPPQHRLPRDLVVVNHTNNAQLNREVALNHRIVTLTEEIDRFKRIVDKLLDHID